MVVGLPSFRAEWPNKHGGAERRSDRSIFLNRFRVIQKRLSDAINIRCCSPGVNAFRSANLMRGRSVAAVCADENRGIDFAAKVLQQSREQNDCAWHIMGELAQEQSRFTAINEHQFRQREVWREPNLVRFLPAADFIEKAGEMMNLAPEVCLRFGRSQ